MTRIVIDPNVRVRGQLTYAAFEDVSGPLMLGQTVEVVEPESNIAGAGRVIEIDIASSLVYLGVDWGSLREVDEPVSWSGRSYGSGDQLVVSDRVSEAFVSGIDRGSFTSSMGEPPVIVHTEARQLVLVS